MQELENISTKILYNLVSKFYRNKLIITVKPELVFSINETVNYIFEGKGKIID